MQFFTKVEDALALTLQNGVYKQAEIYSRGEAVYVKHGSGFARVGTGISDFYPTSAPNLKVVEINLPPKTAILVKGHLLTIRHPNQ